jgi:hypothetical protein
VFKNKFFESREQKKRVLTYFNGTIDQLYLTIKSITSTKDEKKPQQNKFGTVLTTLAAFQTSVGSNPNITNFELLRTSQVELQTH